LGVWLAFGWPISDIVRVIGPVAWIVLCCATVVQRVRRALG